MALLRAYPIQWAVLLTASLFYGFWLSGPEVPAVLGAATGALLFPAGVAAVAVLIGRARRNPLTPAQVLSVYSVAWIVLTGLGMIGQAG